jgi:plastocyanin
MLRTVTRILAAAAATLVLAAPAAAATVNVQITKTGFTPAAFSVNHGDKVTWRNADTSDHQVVSDTGSFASPILKPGQSWTFTLNTAGTFRYHDGLKPSFKARVTVKGPPPSVALALSVPIVSYGTTINVGGTISTGAANESVEILAQPWGQTSPTQLAIIKTVAGGAFSYPATPSIYTTYTARWKNVSSASVVAQVEPKLRLIAGKKGYMKAIVSAPVSMWHKHVFLQRLSSFGQWVNVASLTLGEQNGRVFKPATYLPKGPSRIRVFLSVNQAGNGLLSAHSGTQALVRKS